jgi:hypothetical protein
MFWQGRISFLGFGVEHGEAAPTYASTNYLKIPVPNIFDR